MQSLLYCIPKLILEYSCLRLGMGKWTESESSDNEDKDIATKVTNLAPTGKYLVPIGKINTRSLEVTNIYST